MSDRPDFMRRETDEWEDAANALARTYCPSIYSCCKCGGPVVRGFICTRCGDPEPYEP